MDLVRIHRISLVVAFLGAIGLASTDASIFRQNHGRRPPIAAIFGFGNKNDEDGNQNGQQSQGDTPPKQYTPQIPRPPGASGRQHLHMQEWQQKLIPPPPPTSSDGKPSQEAANPQEGSSDDAGQPQPPQAGWNQGADSPWQGMENQPPGQHNAVDPFQMLQMDLEAAIQREQDLLSQLHNMTSAIMGMEQREELHLRQLDVLTERVMDVEALSAEEHNQLLEYQANCSILDLEIAKLNGEVEEWKERCQEANELNKKKSVEYAKLVKQLEKAKRESEQLATRVEQHRLDEIRATYNQRKKDNRPFGIIGWMLGMHKRDDEELEDLREAAKSTLIHALQNERNNVEELEVAVNALEQNNSVIALQIQSRDEIIDELNERVAVFEEDKIVLKAALQQLRKDMLEEAPKTQKLIEDLAEAHDEIDRLQAEVASMIDQHSRKAASLESVIADKDSQIAETQSNVTMIGEYVDKLEERLADFAVARRDIDRREKLCAEMEAKSESMEEECNSLREKILVGEKDQEQLKNLMQEMVVDRTTLQERIDQLTVEKEQAGSEVERLMVSVSSLQNEVGGLRQQLEQSQHHIQQQRQQLQQQQQVLQQQGAYPGQDIPGRFQEYENRVAGLLLENEQIKQESTEAQTTINDLRRELDNMISSRQELEKLLVEAQATKSDLEGKLVTAVSVQEAAEAKLREETLRHKEHLTEAKAKAESLLKEQSAMLEASWTQDKSELESMLAQAREEAENTLREEREKYEMKLKEKSEESEAKLSKVQSEVETLLKTEYERYERKLSEEKERVGQMLQEGEEKTATQLRLELETEKSKYEELLSQEKDRASRKVKEAEEKLDAKLAEAIAEEKEKLDKLLKDEQEMAIQKAKEERTDMEGKIKVLLTEENEKFESKLQAENQRFIDDLKIKEKKIEELTSALAASEEALSASKLERVNLNGTTSPPPSKQTSKATSPVAEKPKDEKDLISQMNTPASTKEPSQELVANSNTTSSKNSTGSVRMVGNLTRPMLPGRRPSPRPNMPPKKKSASRTLRKFFAQSTGLHGFFSKKYAKRGPAKKLPPRPRTLPTGNSTVAARSNLTNLPRSNLTRGRKAPPGKRLPTQKSKESPVFAVRPKGQPVKGATAPFVVKKPQGMAPPKQSTSQPNGRPPLKSGREPPGRLPPSKTNKLATATDKSQK